jgi:hypothetical protein
MSASGRKNYIAINTGTYTTPVWVELKRITDLEFDDGRPVSERKYRGSDFTKGVTGYRNCKFSFKYQLKRFGLTDAVYALLKAGKVADGTVLDIQFLETKPIVPVGSPLIGQTANGLRGPFHVAVCKEMYPDEEGVTAEVELILADEDIPTTTNPWELVPVTVTIASS